MEQNIPNTLRVPSSYGRRVDWAFVGRRTRLRERGCSTDAVLFDRRDPDWELPPSRLVLAITMLNIYTYIRR